MTNPNNISLALCSVILVLAAFGGFCAACGAMYQSLSDWYTERACQWADVRTYAWAKAWEPVPRQDDSLDFGPEANRWFASRGLR
jgi:hypothetical protein